VGNIKYIRALDIVIVEHNDDKGDDSKGGGDKDIVLHPWRETWWMWQLKVHGYVGNGRLMRSEVT
jgi:hypothetical protein